MVSAIISVSPNSQLPHQSFPRHPAHQPRWKCLKPDKSREIFSTMRLQSGVGKKIRSIMTFHCLTETVMFLSVTSFQIQFHAFKCCICAGAFQRSILAASLSPWKHEIPPQVGSIWYQWKAFQSFARFGQRCWCESKYLPAPNRITLTSLTHYLPLSAIDAQNSASFAGAVRQFAIN